MKRSKITLGVTLLAIASSVAIFLNGCGGGGGGGGSSSVLYYPYENVYGTTCATSEPTPGCTFLKSNGQRITVSEDGWYSACSYGGSDCLDYVIFEGNTGYVFDYTVANPVTGAFGNWKNVKDVSQFAGWVGGSYIGVGTTGLFWEDIRGGTYWLGRTGVLYSANFFESNYGQAINSPLADAASDSSFAAMAGDQNDELVRRAAKGLETRYGMKAERAMAVASALNRWEVASADRGYTTTSDMDVTFNQVFGSSFSSALAAVNKFRNQGDVSGIRELTNRFADVNGILPHQAVDFLKDSYGGKALANFGYEDIEKLEKAVLGDK